MKTKLFLLLAFLCQMTFAQVSDQGLIAYYPFNNNTQNEVPNGGAYNLLDYGTGSDITFVSNGGVTGGAINNNNAYQFNNGKSLMATNFFVLLENNPNQNFSVSYWVWYNSPLPSYAAVNTQVEAFSSLFVRGNTTFGTNTTSNGSGAFNLGGNSILTTFSQTWYHMAIVFDASQQTLTVYRNGSSIGSISTTGSAIYKYNNRFVIGGGSNADGSANSSKSFSGKIDEVYVFNRVLQQLEVTALYNKEIPTSNCPQGSISLTSQAEIDAFISQYPNCTEIDGSLTITGFNGNTTDLSGLSSITSITGDLTISGTQLTTLNGALPNLTNVGNSIYITANPLLTTVDGLNQITSSLVGLLQIHNNNNLVNIGGLNGLTGVFNLYITNNPALQMIDGLSALSGFIQVVYIDTNEFLTSINTLNQITTACVVTIGNSPALTTINGFNQLNAIVPFGAPFTGGESNQTLGGWSPIIWIHSTAISNLNNFSSLTNFNGFMLALDNNNNLTDLSGLSNVTPSSVGNLRLNGNENLSNCAIQVVCDIIDLDIAQLNINDNATGCESVTVVQNACDALSSELFDLSNVVIYPVPFTDELNINFSQNIEGNVKLFDFSGKVLHDAKINDSSINISALDHLSKGIYMLQITDLNGDVYNQKIVK